jgi:hypothetical protein
LHEYLFAGGRILGLRRRGKRDKGQGGGGYNPCHEILD